MNRWSQADYDQAAESWREARALIASGYFDPSWKDTFFPPKTREESAADAGGAILLLLLGLFASVILNYI